MRSLLLLITMFAVSGCAGMDFEPKRWVKGDTFYSTNLPSIEVTVKRDLPFQNSSSSDKLTTSTRGSDVTGKKTDNFYFSNNDVHQLEKLTIRIETLKAYDRWYMAPLNYAEFPNSISSGEETLAGLRFSTGIFVINKKTYALLIKGYGRVVGDTTRFQIGYLERVGMDWLEKNPKWLSKEDSDFLANFERRAKTSFTISKYGGASPPVQP